MAFLSLLIFIGALLWPTLAQPLIQNETIINDCESHQCDHTKNVNVNNHYYNHGCFCDYRCRIYNDCCWDYNKEEQPPGIEPSITECRHVKTADRSSFMMITSCSPSFEEKETYEGLCRSKSSELIYTVPVTGRRDQYVYKNVYCALCNGEKNYTFWDLQLDCPHKINSENVTLDLLNLTECQHKLQNPYPNTSHICNELLVKKCNNSDGASKCETESSGVVYSSAGKFYKNIHCFRCNRKTNEHLSCGPLPFGQITTHAYINPYSYFVLINFNRRDTLFNGKKRLTSCPHHHWYDHVENKCRPIFKLSTPFNNQTVFSLNCTLDRLQQDEYILLENQTIYRNATDTFYDKHSYLMNNSDVFICQTIQHPESSIETYLTLIGMGVSLSALSFLIVVYILMPVIWNISGLIYLSFSLSLFFAQFLFVLSRYTHKPDICQPIATAMHYSFLASFFWLNVVTINIWVTVCRNPCETVSRRGWKPFLFYSIYAWLAPLLFIIPSVTLESHKPSSKFAPNYGYTGICWLRNNNGILLFFAGPLAVIIFFNIIAYIHTAVTIYKMHRFAVQSGGTGNVRILIINAKLCLLTGFTWSFGYVASVTHSPELRIIFIFLNATYGLWLAICFFTTEKIFTQLRKKIQTVTQGSSTKTVS